MNSLDTLRELVSIDSQYPNEMEITKYLLDIFRSIGMDVTVQKVDENRSNLFAQRGEADKYLCFYGHMDTVHYNEDDGWNTDPFKLTKKVNNLYGLGAYDMKCGLSVILNVIQSTNKPIKVFFAVDEENISQGAWKAIQENNNFFEDIQLVISAEPSFEHGLNSITIGRTGRCIFEGRIQGKSVHIARYDEGEDAIQNLSRFLQDFYDKRTDLYESKDSVVQVRKVYSEANGMSVSGQALIEVEALLSPPDTIKGTISKLNEISGLKFDLKVRETPYLEGYRFSDFPNKHVIMKIMEDINGEEPKLIFRTSVGDDNVIASLGIPVITIGPEGGNSHSADEYVTIDSISKLEKIYKLFIQELI